MPLIVVGGDELPARVRRPHVDRPPRPAGVGPRPAAAQVNAVSFAHRPGIRQISGGSPRGAGQITKMRVRRHEALAQDSEGCCSKASTAPWRGVKK
jgi:hypothetical protein